MPTYRGFTVGTLFRRTVPQSATVVEKKGRTFAKWKSRGKAHAAPVAQADDGGRTNEVETGTYSARF